MKITPDHDSLGSIHASLVASLREYLHEEEVEMLGLSIMEGGVAA